MTKSGSVKREKIDGINAIAGRAIISLFSFKTSRRTSRRLRLSSVLAEKERKDGFLMRLERSKASVGHLTPIESSENNLRSCCPRSLIFVLMTIVMIVIAQQILLSNGTSR